MCVRLFRRRVSWPLNLNKQSIESRIGSIARDREHGASELARLCLQIAADSALYYPAPNTPTLIATLMTQAVEMSAARPSMAPLYNLLTWWRRELQDLRSLDLATARRRAANSAAAVATVSHDAVRQVAFQARALIGQSQCVITHSSSSTLFEVFSGLKGKDTRFIVSESRPLFEGRRLAQQLSAWGLQTTLITDAQMGIFAAQADMAMVGADSLLEDGSVVNKAGTRLLALAAREQSVPFYVCCEKFKQRHPDMPPFELEEMCPEELEVEQSAAMQIRNVYFDVTPPELITGWVNEDGLTSSPNSR